VLSQFKIPEKGCRKKREDKQAEPFDPGCPFFSLDVAGGVWSCKCALSGLYEVSLGRTLMLHPKMDTYHETRPDDCPFNTYPHSLELQADLETS